MESELLIGVILFFAGALAGFIDSIVGGGGLISLPALMLTNMPVAMCLGTNKLSSVFGSGTAMINFARNKLVDWAFVRWIMPFTLLISMVGAYIAVYVPGTFLKPLIIVLLLAVFIVVLTKKDWGTIAQVERKSGWKLLAYVAVAIVIGLYDGFLGPGTGVFLIFYFLFMGYDFLGASGNAKVLNTVSNFGSLLMFIYMDQVNYGYGLAVAAGQIIGATAGSKLAMVKGAGLVRFLFIAMSLTMLMKLSYDYLLSQGII